MMMTLWEFITRLWARPPIVVIGDTLAIGPTWGPWATHGARCNCIPCR